MNESPQDTRRAFLKSLGMAGAVLAAPHGWGLAQTAATRRPPNVVFILVDDMGWPDPACYGHPFHETPHIDRLASQGMRFTDAYAAAPVCSPTRASILSGQYPAHVGITDFIPGHWRPYAKLRVPTNRQQYLPLEVTTFAEALGGAGYTCGAFGKWHLGGPKHFPDKQGFDQTLVTSGRHFGSRSVPDIGIGKDDYLTEVLSEQAEDFMDAHQDEPFFLYLAHYAVHIPLEAREALIDKYRNKPKPGTGVNNPVYAAMVEHVDQSVGRVLGKIDELGLADNTVVVFFSDNGGLRQRFDGDGGIVSTNAPLRDEKGTLYEGGIREPLIVRWPGAVKPGSVCAEPVTSVDFYPTFLEMAGATGDAKHVLDGESLVPLLREGGRLKRESIYWHYPHYHHSSPAGALRKGPWKLIEFYEDGRLELYNLRDDLSETTNLAEKRADLAQELQRELAAWRSAVGAELPTENPDYDPARAHEWGKHP